MIADNSESRSTAPQSELEIIAEEQRRIAEIGRIVSSSPILDDVFSAFADQASSLVPFDRLAISTIDPRSGLISGVHISGIQMDEANLTGPYTLEDSPLPAPVYEDHEVVAANAETLAKFADTDVVADNSARIAAGLKSAMFVPIVLRRNMVGSLIFRSKLEDPYGDREIRLAGQIAAQISGVISSSQQFALLEKESAERQRLADEQARIAEIGRIVSSTPDIQEVLTAFVEQARSLVPFDRIVVVTVNADAGGDLYMTEVLVDGFDVEGSSAGQSYSLSTTPMQRDVITEQKLFVANGDAYVAHAERNPGEQKRRDLGLNSILLVPLVWQGRVIGSMNLRSVLPQAYGEHEIELAKQIGAQIAGAIATSNQLRRLEDAVANIRTQAAALAAADDAVVIRRADTTIEYVNAAFEKQTGYSEEEVVGDDSQYLRSVTFSSEVYDRMWAHVRQGKVWRATVSGMHKDGTEYVVDTTLSPIFNDHGEIDKFVGIRRNVTDRVRADEAIKTQAAALEAASDAVVILKPDNSIEWVNEAFVRDTGYSKEEAIGQSSSIMRSDRDDPDVFDGMWGQLRSGITWRRRMWTRRKDGSDFQVDASVTPVLDESGNIARFIGIRRDITDLIQAEKDRETRRDLDAQNQQLQQLNEQREEFFSTVSHELRTPLTSVMAFTDILSRDRNGTLSNRQLEHLDVIKRNSRNLNGLIDDMLDFSRLNTDQVKLIKSEFEVHSLLDSLVESLEPTADQRSQTLVIEPHSEPVWIVADHGRIIQIISNLITNSCKYSPPSTRITVKVEAQGGQASIAVADEGIGIRDEDLDKIFSPFFRSDQIEVRKEIGTGLGLAISKTLVDMHGGNIEATSKLTEGTEVTVTLPGASSTSTVIAKT